MSNATPHNPSASASQAARSFSRSVARFVPVSIKPVVFKLSRKLSVTYWPGRRRSVSAMLLALLSSFVPGLAGAGPVGGQVVAGSAVVLKPTATTTQVNQASQNVIINWQSFSIGAGEAVRFVQPSASAVALNRVIGSDPSRIFGTLQANGKVFLVNSAGVYFAPGAKVDVGGLVATSMNISNASFMSGKYKFDATADAGEVANYGQLRGAFVVLAAPQVTNAGSIVTTGGAGGTAALAAGGRVSLDIAGDKLVTMSVDAAVANAAVVNSGSVSADGGKVFMSASSANAVLDTVINTSGIVRAASIANRNGRIVIDGGSAGVVKVSGTLAASGAGAGAKGGAVSVLGDKVALQNGASIDVSGDTGGGSALIGGDLHGAGGVKTAAFTRVDTGAIINADALVSGNGGKVVVWADQHTGFAGAISAKGGALGGDGGFVETSGKATLAFVGKVNTTAAHGKTGSLLLDPTDITIDNSPTTAGGGTTSTLNVGDLIVSLGTTNVTVNTTSGAGSAGNIVVSNDVTWGGANSLTLKADGNITNNASIKNTASGALNLYADGAITSGGLVTGSGAISIAGSAGGSSRAASVVGGTIDSTSGAVSIRSAGAVSTGGVHAGSGTISIDSNAGVAITGALNTTSSSASAIVVNAGANGSAGNGSGGDITVAGGSVSVGGGGFAILYTGTVAGSTGLSAAVGAGSGRFRYASAAGTVNFSAPLTAGVSAVYREQPTLTVSYANTAITYGDAVPILTPSYTGLKNGDVAGQALASGPNLTVGGTLSTGNKLVAGSHAVTVSNAVDQLGYAVATTNGSLTVAQKALTSSGSTAADKTYNGVTAAAVNTSATTVAAGGIIGGDVVSVNNGAATSGSFADKNVGINKTVIIGGITLQGADAGNYTVTGSAAASIAPKALTIAATGANKVYDGATSATVVLSDDRVSGDSLSAAGTASYGDKNVGIAKAVSVTGVSLSGADAGNYTYNTTVATSADITPRALTITASGVNKVYDSLPGATVNLADNRFAGDVLNPGFGAASYADKNVGIAKPVSVSGLSLGGADAGNYSFNTTAATAANITPKALTIAATGNNKVYDGLTTATATLSDDRFAGDTLSTTFGTASYADKNAGVGKTVSVSSVSLGGADAGNYSYNTTATTAADITQKTLTIAATGVNKVYDSLLGATVNLSDNRVSGDVLSASGTASYTDKNVGIAKAVSVSGVTLSGADAGNYSYNTMAATSANITPKALTGSGSTAADRAYNGLTAATVDTSATSVAGGGVTSVDGLAYAGDVVGVDHAAVTSGSFADKNVGIGKTVTISGIALQGADAGNYTIATTATATATITPKALTIAATGSNKVYNGLLGATVTLSDDRVAGDALTAAGGAASYGDKNVGTAKAVGVTGISLGGADAGNYTYNTTAATTADITAKALTIGANSIGKVYDGSTGATATLTDNRIAGDVLLTNFGTASYGNKNVGTAKPVSVIGITVGGADAGNYSFNTTATAAANIAPKGLTITASGINKVYDGSLAATVNLADDRVSGDLLSAVGTASYVDKNVGVAKAVGVSGISLGGADAGNYTYNTTASTSADITGKTLIIAASGVNKIYDGLPGVSVTLSDNRAAGDVLNTNFVTASYADKNVGIAKPIGVTGVSLSGADASNYSYNTTATASANITPKALTIAASGVGKVYNGLLGATATLSDDRVAGDVLTTVGTASYGDKNVGIAKAVGVSGIVLGGADAGNYTYNTAATTTAGITAKALTITASGIGKAYDGLLGATVNLADDRVSGDVLTTVGAASFTDKNVGTVKTVNVSGVILGGVDAGNYTYNTTAATTANITPKVLAATVAAPDKTYDGNATATPTLSIDAAGLVGVETVTVSGTAQFNSKDVLVANLVTVQSAVLANGANGGLSTNYSLASGQTVTAHIAPKALTATATAAGKVYDGTAAGTAVMNIVAAGLVGTETVTATGTGVFDSKNVVTPGNKVTVNAVTLVNGANGGLASNYSLGISQTGLAQVTAKPLTASASAPGKVYDGTTAATPVLTITAGLVAGEALGVSGAGTFNVKNVVGANLVTVNSVTLANGGGGGIASNYSLAAGQTAAAGITPKALTASVSAPSKVYDGTTTATGSVLTVTGGLVGVETVGASGSAVFNSKDVLEANQVTVQSAALSDGGNGGLASNYSLAPGQVAGNVHITAKPLTATAVSGDKVYDGNLRGAAVISIAGAGLVGLETVTASGTGLFNSKDVNSATTLLVNSVLLANGANGGLASNYSVGAGQSVAAKITRRPSVTFIGATGGNWAEAANWEAGAIPDLANVANVIIPTGKSVVFTAGVPALNGAVQLDSIDGAGALVVGGGTLAVANALKIGSYAQSDGVVGAGTLSATSGFNQAGGKLTVAGKADIVQSSGVAMLGDLVAADLSIGGSGAAQTAAGTVLVKGTVTLDTGAGDVVLANKKNDFGTVSIVSGHDVTLVDVNGLIVNGKVAGTLKTTTGPLTVGPTTVGGNFIASVLGAINQTGALDVTGSTIIDSAGLLSLDDKKNVLRGRVKVTGGADVLLAWSGNLAIGGDVAGKLVLTGSGPVIQTAGDALHVAGTSSIDAGTGAVTLLEKDNHFGGALSLKGGAVSVLDKGALALGESSVAGDLSITVGGALTQTGALTAGGATSVNAAGQAITLTNAGNDFAGALSLGGANTQVTDKNALTLGSGDVKGNLQLTAKGDITQKAGLTVSGITAIDTTGAVVLGNEANDFVGAVSANGSSILLKDKNVLTLSKLTASKADLAAATELQVAPGGIIDAPDIALSLSPTAVKGAIGTPTNHFEVRKGARVVLGSSTPAVPTYIGGEGAQVVVGNLASSINYSNEAWSMDARSRVNSSFANIMQATSKKADSNADLIERGLPTDLTVPIPYPHEGAMRTKSPDCNGRESCN